MRSYRKSRIKGLVRSVLTHDEQLRVIRAIANFDTDKQIIQMIKDDFGKSVNSSYVSHYRNSPNWQSMIEKYREEYEAKIGEEELASKRRRIRELTDAYYRLKPKNETLMDSVSVLGRIREEVEGKSSGGNIINQYNQYNGLSDEDLRKVIDENTRFLQIAEKRKQQLTIEVNGNQESQETGQS